MNLCSRLLKSRTYASIWTVATDDHDAQLLGEAEADALANALAEALAEPRRWVKRDGPLNPAV